MLLIPLSCYHLLENYSWSFTRLRAKATRRMVVSSALRHRPWAPCHTRPGFSGQAPHTLPCGPSQVRGWDGCFMRRSRCSGEAPASWDQGGQSWWLLSHENKAWRKGVLSAGCPVRALPRAQEVAARVLSSAGDPCSAQPQPQPSPGQCFPPAFHFLQCN